MGDRLAGCVHAEHAARLARVIVISLRPVVIVFAEIRQDLHYLIPGRPSRNLPPVTTAPALPLPTGFCLWFTGLSGAGKSTIAEIVVDAAAGARPSCRAARRRRGARAPVEGAHVLQRRPRHQHPPHRVRREPPRPQRRRRGDRRDLAVPRGARRGARLDRQLRRDPRRHVARGLRGARREGPLRQGPRGRDPRVHRRLRPVRATARPGGPDRDRGPDTRGSPRPRSSPGSKAPG